MTHEVRRHMHIFAALALAMLAFAGNSLLARLALDRTSIDFASFTGIRLATGSLVLWGLLQLRRRDTRARQAGSWGSAFALFAYAAAFSLAYLHLTAATGALVLFGAVQVTMIAAGFVRGERLGAAQVVGLALALAGLLVLLLPGLSAPPLGSAILMAMAGVAWGVYSLRGRGSLDPLADTAGNFIRALSFAALLCLALLPRLAVDSAGALYAAVSGGLASGLGYAIWYWVLPRINATRAAVVQLSVPAIAAAGGVLLLGEHMTLRLAVSSLVILGGIAMVIVTRERAP